MRNISIDLNYISKLLNIKTSIISFHISEYFIRLNIVILEINKEKNSYNGSYFLMILKYLTINIIILYYYY